jgi:hypothetical protein
MNMEQNKYVVKVVNMFANLIEVDANNEEEAKEKAKEIILNNEKKENIPLFYESTLPENFWAVIPKDEFDRLKGEAEQESQATQVPVVEE